MSPVKIVLAEYLLCACGYLRVDVDIDAPENTLHIIVFFMNLYFNSFANCSEVLG